MPHTSRIAAQADGEISLLGLGAVVLRWRRVIVILGLLGFAGGIVLGLTRPRTYVSSATFLPQGSEGSSSSLAGVASQFGIRMPTTTSAWGPATYVQLLRSPTLLEPIVQETIEVREQNGRRAPVMDLLEVRPAPPAERLDLAVRKLSRLISAAELRPISGVEVRVTTKWPSVSHTLAERLVRGVNQFNLQTRKSQAAAERHFAEERVAETERSLRDAEDRLQAFLQRNRIINPNSEQAFERERLQREVTRRAGLYASLLQSLEEARLREVRDTPVITLLSEPRVPLVAESRGTVKKAIVGAVLGTVIGLVIALVAQAMSNARRQASAESQEFFNLVAEATPRFLRGRHQ